MYRDKKVLVTICARGGSKGVPKKNLKLLLGKPLITYTIEQAKVFPWVDRIVVSTDDLEIKNIAEKAGVEIPFIRPKKLATDKAPKVPVIIHAIKKMEKIWKESYDVILDLDPTSPLRDVEDIENCMKIFFDNPDTKSVVTAYESNKNPYFNMIEYGVNGFVYLSKTPRAFVARRQDAPKVYAMNASIYVFSKKDFLKEQNILTDKTRLYVMPGDRSIDIDRPSDFDFVEFVFNKRNG